MVNWLHGPTESGKSWIAQVASMEAIQRGDNVLYLDYESDPESITQRFTLLGCDLDTLHRHLHYVAPEYPTTSSPDLFGMMIRGPLALAVIDGVTDAMTVEQLDPNNATDVAEWVRRMPRRIARASGAAVLCVDHVPKSDTGGARFPTGSERKLAAVSGAAYSLTMNSPPAPGRTVSGTLGLSKDRPGAVRPASKRGKGKVDVAAGVTFSSVGEILTVTLSPPGGQPQPQPDNTHNGGAADNGAITAYIRANPGASGRTIEKAITGKGTDIRETLKKLVTAGQLHRTGSGPTTAYHVVR